MSLYQNRYRKALKYSRLLASFIPFIKMVALTGSMAIDNGKAVTEKSDIDFFIQTEKKRIWTVRFFSTALIWILGQKRHDRGSTKKIAGRFCLNWYGIENLPKKRSCQYIILCQYPVSLSHSCESRNPVWIPHPASPAGGQVRNDKRKKFKLFFELILSGKFGDWFENIFRKYQIKRIERDPRTHQLDSKVRCGDEEIGLHPANPCAV